MRKKFHNFFQLLLSGKYRSIVFRLLDYVPDSILEYDRFYIVRCIDFKSRLVRELRNGITFSIVAYTDSDLDLIGKQLNINKKIINFHLAGAKEKTKIIKIHKNERCIAVAFVKIADEIKSFSGYQISLEKNSSVTWFFGTYVHPDFRMRGYHANLIACAYDFSKMNGSKGLYGEIHYLNEKSIHAHKKLGFEVYRNMIYIKLFKKKYFKKSHEGFHV